MDDMTRLSPPATPLFLAPNAAYVRERRHSTASMDSSVSHNSSSRSSWKSSKRSSSKTSEYDEDIHDVTLLSFLQSSRDILCRFGSTSKRVMVNALRKSRPRPTLVCEGEILEQTSMICRDHVLHKLAAKDLMPRRPPVTAAHWSKSTYVIDACLTLEHAYPRVYSNVSRKLCMTMTSTKVVRSAFNSVLDVLFEGPTTWGKVVSMFSVCGLFAEECAMQGHADYVSDVVDSLVDFTNSRLLEWLVSQGGWDCFPCPKDDESLFDNVGRMLIATLASAFLVIPVSLVYRFYHLWDGA